MRYTFADPKMYHNIISVVAYTLNFNASVLLAIEWNKLGRNDDRCVINKGTSVTVALIF